MLLSKHKIDSINKIFSNYKIIQPPDYSKIVSDKHIIASKILRKNFSAPYLSSSIRLEKMNILSGFDKSVKQFLVKNNKNIKTIYNRKIPNLHDLPQRPDDVRIIDIPQNLPQIIFTKRTSKSQNLPSVHDNPEFDENLQEVKSEIALPVENIDDKQPSIPEIPTNINVEKEKNIEKSQKSILAESIKGKYSLSNENSVIELPPDYSTNDEDEYSAYKLINENITSWNVGIDKPNRKIYSKLTTVIDNKNNEWETSMLYLDATIDFPAEVIAGKLCDPEFKIKMEKNSKNKIISSETTPYGKIFELYNYMKMPFPFDDRDMITRKKIWYNYGGIQNATLSHMKSIIHPDYPEKEKPVRGDFINRSEYIKPINTNQCRIIIATLMNLKLSRGASLVAKKGPELQEKRLDEFLENINK